MSESPSPPTEPKASAPEGPDLWDRTGEWLAKYGAVPAVVAIMIAVFSFHFHIFLGETAGDDLTFHFAESARLADCIRHGDFDFWNPSANGGYASAYYYQVLPQLASALPAALFGHHLFFFQLSVVLPLVLAPAAAYRGMRLMGATPWQAAIAAFAVAFMNGESRWGAGSAGTFQVGLYTQTWALCVFPLALGHGARWLSEGKSLAPAIAWGGFTFLCHPFAGISLGLALVIAFLAKFVVTWRLWLSPTMGGVVLLYLGGLPIAVVLVTALIPNVPSPRPLPLLTFGVVAIVFGLLDIWKFRATDKSWRHPSVQSLVGELHRLAILGVALILTTAPVLLPLTIDRDGFGGFPHRVSDEVGPGFLGLGKWYIHGKILDFIPGGIGMRLPILTIALPVVVIFTAVRRPTLMRWLLPPALVFAVLLGLGPNVGKIGDDLFPPVRALGAMQTVLALGVGAGLVMLGQWLWQAPWDRWLAFGGRVPPVKPGQVSSTIYGARTVIAAISAALAVLVAVPGGKALIARVNILGDYKASHRDQLLEVNAILAKQPPGRKQVGPGAENHWWNLLSYAYERVPSVLQMGGGGLQASPNYDFLWTSRDYVRNAWIYDAPYLVFDRSKGEHMPLGETIARTENYEIRRLPSPGLVSPVRIVGVLPPWYRTEDLGHIFALQWSKTRMALDDLVLAYIGAGDDVPFPGPPSGKTLRWWRQDSPGDDADIVAEVEATAPTTFIIRESWHPRWHGYIDGVEVPVRRVTPDFPAVDVGPGKHTLELRFERPLWALLIWLLWPGTALAAWLVLRRLEKKRERERLASARVVHTGVAS